MVHFSHECQTAVGLYLKTLKYIGICTYMFQAPISSHHAVFITLHYIGRLADIMDSNVKVTV